MGTIYTQKIKEKFIYKVSKAMADGGAKGEFLSRDNETEFNLTQTTSIQV